MNKIIYFISNRYNFTDSYEKDSFIIESYPKEPIFTLLSDAATLCMAVLVTFFL